VENGPSYVQVVNEENLMDAGGPLQASVRLLSGGDRDENGNSISQEAQPRTRAQQRQLGRQYISLYTRAAPKLTPYLVCVCKATAG
jgi:hypothetical protein